MLAASFPAVRGVDHPVRREPCFRHERSRFPASRAGRARARRCRWRTGSPSRRPGAAAVRAGPGVPACRLISTTTLCSRQVPNTASGSNSDSGRPARPARTQLSTGAVPEHVHVRVADRGHHPLSHRVGGHPQLGARWPPPRRAGPAGPPADMTRRRGCRRCRSGCGTGPTFLVEPGNQCELGLQTLGDSPLATMSRGEWSVSAIHSWPSARAASAISPGGLPPSDQSGACGSPAALRAWPWRGGFRCFRQQPGQVVRLLVSRLPG